MPVSPVPIVKAFEAVAFTVTEPPRDTEEPLIAMLEFVSAELPMSLNVLLSPDMVLLVRVSELFVVATTVVSIEIVPIDVMGPPSNPVPVST